MLKLRARLYSPEGVRGRVLPALGVTYTRLENATATLTFSLSTRMAGKMDAPFVVGVEYSTGGRFAPIPQHHLFVVTEDSGDDADQSKTVSFSGESYVTWLLGRTYLHWSQFAINGERLWTETGHPASAGTIIGGMIVESKARGWGTQLSTDFTWDRDSAGELWGADNKVLQNWKLLTPLVKVLGELTASGLCDWTVEGLTLRLFRAGTLGTVRENVVLGGPRVSRVPVKTDATGIFTHLTVVPEKAYHWLYLDNAGADTRFGRLEATMTQSGIESHEEATKLAQPALLAGRTVFREESFEWTPTLETDVVPWRDFDVSDTVSARARGGKLPRRVIGLVVRADNDEATVRVVVGEMIGSAQSKLRKRVGSVSVGGIVGGSGGGFPATGGPSPLKPDAPNGLIVVSNIGSWTPNGVALSEVGLSWQAVTSAIDGSESIVNEYEVWSRLPSGVLALDTASTGTDSVIGSWTPDVPRVVQVRAKSAQGVYSDFSLELTVTPAAPSSVVPAAPSGLTIVSNVGAWTPAGPVATITLGWDAVTESTDSDPITVAEYELWDANAPMLRVPGAMAKFSLPSELTGTYRVRARTVAGVFGDLSDPITVTGATPAAGAFAPTAPMLTTGFGNVSARWDGAYTSTPVGAHIVWIEARLGADAWARQGAALIGTGTALVTLGDVGDTVDVRAVAYDQLGREVGISEVASIEIAAIDGDDIAVNSLKGNRIEVGTIFVDRLEPNIGDTLNLGGNAVAINLNSRVDDAVVAIEHTQQNVDSVQADTVAAATAADAANQAVASLAAGRVLTAESALAVLSGKIDTYDNSFLFLPDGLHIREATDARAEMVLASAGIRLNADGTTVAELNQGQMIVDQIVVNGGQVANHIIDGSIPGHTTWRSRSS